MGGRQKAVLVVKYKESARVGRFLLSQALRGLRSTLGVPAIQYLKAMTCYIYCDCGESGT